MDYVLNIDTDKYNIINNKYNYNYNYNFLDNLIHYNINIHIFYNILNSLELYKLKNLYNFIYKRIDKLNIDNMNYIKPSINISAEMFNNELEKYIDSELKSIIIINSIQQYYQPTTRC